jgi:hypothetical protein
VVWQALVWQALVWQALVWQALVWQALVWQALVLQPVPWQYGPCWHSFSQSEQPFVYRTPEYKSETVVKMVCNESSLEFYYTYIL